MFMNRTHHYYKMPRDCAQLKLHNFVVMMMMIIYTTNTNYCFVLNCPECVFDIKIIVYCLHK